MTGSATCTSLMVPAPWARHAAEQYLDGDDVGVHLTLNAEHARYRWGPLTHAPSLLSGDGGFPSTIDDLWEHADPDEVRRELRTQVERALAWGIDVTHLAPHLTSITLRPEFFDIYLELAVEFALPIRLPSTISEERAGFPFRRLAAEEGVVFPDHFDHDWRPGSRARTFAALDVAGRRRHRDPHPAGDRHAGGAGPHAVRRRLDRRPRPRPRPGAGRPDRRRRRDVDRLPRPQGCDARRLSAAATSPERSTSKNAPVEPVVFSRPRM